MTMMNRTFGATFLVVDCMIDAPIRGIITVNAEAMRLLTLT